VFFSNKINVDLCDARKRLLLFRFFFIFRTLMEPAYQQKRRHTAQQIAATLASNPNANIRVFSTGRRASRALVEECYKALMDMPGMKERIVAYNIELIKIQYAPNDVRTLNSLPTKEGN
jgi:hypothetical protein